MNDKQTENMRELLSDEILPKDLYHLMSSYLSEGERCYYTEDWLSIEESHGNSILMIKDPALWESYILMCGIDEFVKSCTFLGSLIPLKWARKNGYFFRCDVDAITRNGHLEMLKWVKEIEDVQNWKTDSYAPGGNFKLLKWGKKTYCE